MSRQTSPSNTRVLTGTISAAKSPRVQRRHRLLVAGERERVLVAAADVELAGDVLGGVAHRGVGVGELLDDRRVERRSCAPPIGTIDIDSTPPASPASMPPAAMRSATIAVACRPDEQKRLMVIAGTSSGRPARKPTWRATFRPCSASGWRSRARRPRSSPGSTSARRSASRDDQGRQIVGAGVARRRPCGARPTGVRTADRMATSRMVGSSVPKRLALLSMCWMRSRVFGSPHSDRNASRSRSRMCCSLTAAPAGTAPPDRTRASWPARSWRRAR